MAYGEGRARGEVAYGESPSSSAAIGTASLSGSGTLTAAGTPAILSTTGVGIPHTLFVGAGTSLNADSDYTVTLTSGASVGERVWVFHVVDGGDTIPSNAPPMTSADSKGNTYTTFQAAIRNGVTGGTVIVMGFSATVATALVPGDTVTITNTTGDFGAVRRCTVVAAATGVNTLDRQATSDPGSVSSLSIGPTSATDTVNEIVFGFWGLGTRTFTPGAGYTLLGTAATTTGSSDRQLSVEYKIVSTTGTQTATASLNSATTVIGAMATYRGVAAQILGGSGTLTAAGVPAFSRSVNTTGSGTLTATAIAVTVAGNASLTGSGTSTAAAVVGVTGTAPLSGDGTVAGSGSPSFADTPSLTGSGALSATGTPRLITTVDLSGSGALDAVGEVNSFEGTADLSGLGTLTALGLVGFVEAVDLAGSGTLTASGVAGFSGTANPTGEGTLAAQVDQVTLRGQASLTAAGTLTTAAVPHLEAVATYSSSGTLVASGTPQASGTAFLDADGNLSTLGTPGHHGVAFLTGDSEVTTVAFVPRDITVTAALRRAWSADATATHPTGSTRLAERTALARTALTAVQRIIWTARSRK